MKPFAARSLAERVLLVVVLLLAAAGCQQTITDNEEASAAPPNPRQRLAELADRYRQARTYQDAGELRFLVDGAPEDEFRSLPFSVALERPNKIRVHALDTMSVADGRLVRAIVESLSGQVLVQPCPAKVRLSDLYADEMLAAAMHGQLDVELPQLVLLAGDDPLDRLARDCTATQLSDSEFQGQKCRRVALDGPAGKSVLWIERDSGLLVKYEFPLDEIRKRFPLAALWAEFRGARIDEPVDPVAFQVELPDGIKLVKRFVLPPPAAPPAPLAKAVDEFTFIHLDGTAIGRESLAGKVVVLDMWATWCGWCFEGLPLLEKVYQKYKDHDEVVILAVNKDELAVANAKVEQAFAQHKLTIPIVRDQQQIAERVFHLEGLPTMVVLGRDGTVQDYHVGYDPQLADTLPAKLERLLAGDNLAQHELDAYQQAQQAYEERLSKVLVDAGESPAGEPEVARKPESSK
jgi:thiol-disulfide isomerase/thioredoxin